MHFSRDYFHIFKYVLHNFHIKIYVHYQHTCSPIIFILIFNFIYMKLHYFILQCILLYIFLPLHLIKFSLHFSNKTTSKQSFFSLRVIESFTRNGRKLLRDVLVVIFASAKEMSLPTCSTHISFDFLRQSAASLVI